MTGPRLLLTITFAIATMCVALAFATGDPHVVIRWTARTSLVLFALAYVARPATQLWPRRSAKRLLRERKWLGDGFAVSHLAHLFAIIAVASRDWSAFIAGQSPTVIVALAMFVLLFAMAITSIDRVRKAMPRRGWLLLHRTGMHLAWIVFASTYVPLLASGVIWTLPVALLVVIATIRAMAWLRGRDARRQIAALTASS
jgi:methionine sulfoxide reductase heme-binding subunit